MENHSQLQLIHNRITSVVFSLTQCVQHMLRDAERSARGQAAFS